MRRRIYVIPADNEVTADVIADAAAADAVEVAQGIPRALADLVTPAELPTIVTVEEPDPDPPVESPPEVAPEVIEAEDALVAMFDKVAAGGSLSATDKGAIPDLAVKALGGRAKVDRLRRGDAGA